MSNKVATVKTPANASLLDMRRDAKHFPRVGAVSRDVAIVQMSKIVSEAFMLKGQTADASNIGYISTNIVDELQADLDRKGTRNISFAEISRIIRRAILNDEMFGISVATLYKVIMGYINGEGHDLQEQVNTQGGFIPAEVTPMIEAYTGQLLKNAKI